MQECLLFEWWRCIKMSADRTLRAAPPTLRCTSPWGGGIQPDLTTVNSFNTQKILLPTWTLEPKKYTEDCLAKLLKFQISTLQPSLSCSVFRLTILFIEILQAIVLFQIPISKQDLRRVWKIRAKAKPYFIFDKCSTKFDNQVCYSISVLDRKNICFNNIDSSVLLKTF